MVDAGHDVFHKKGEPEMVNVGVKLARKEQVARGNTLWYRVTFANGKPSTFRANKQVSADMCALLGEEEERPL